MDKKFDPDNVPYKSIFTFWTVLYSMGAGVAFGLWQDSYLAGVFVFALLSFCLEVVNNYRK